MPPILPEVTKMEYENFNWLAMPCTCVMTASISESRSVMCYENPENPWCRGHKQYSSSSFRMHVAMHLLICCSVFASKRDFIARIRSYLLRLHNVYDILSYLSKYLSRPTINISNKN